MEIKPVNGSVTLRVKNDVTRHIKDNDRNIEEFVQDKSAFNVSISEEALALLVKNNELFRLLPTLDSYNRHGQLAKA